MILTAIKSFIGGWAGYALIAGLVALGSLWAMHIYDEARYADLQRDVAQAHALQLETAVHEQAEFDKEILAGQFAAIAAKEAALTAANHRMAALSAALNAERKHDAPLAACLDRRLPDSVLDSLPH